MVRLIGIDYHTSDKRDCYEAYRTNAKIALEYQKKLRAQEKMLRATIEVNKKLEGERDWFEKKMFSRAERVADLEQQLKDYQLLLKEYKYENDKWNFITKELSEVIVKDNIKQLALQFESIQQEINNK